MGWILLALIVGAVLLAISIYNRLVAGRNRFKNAFAQIDVQLTRRHDLIPNLVETAKGYMKHESGVFERVSHLRGHPEMAVGQRAGEESGLSRSIGRLFALAEAYPELKASEGFQQLHGSLVQIEDQLQYARRYYNGSVRDNNNLVEGFPSLLVARLFGFRVAEFFEIELASQREPSAVTLSGT